MRIYWLIILMILIRVTGFVSAQEANETQYTQEFVIDNGKLRFFMPDDWHAQVLPNKITSIVEDDFTILVYEPIYYLQYELQISGSVNLATFVGINLSQISDFNYSFPDEETTFNRQDGSLVTSRIYYNISFPSDNHDTNLTSLYLYELELELESIVLVVLNENAPDEYIVNEMKNFIEYIEYVDLLPTGWVSDDIDPLDAYKIYDDNRIFQADSTLIELADKQLISNINGQFLLGNGNSTINSISSDVKYKDIVISGNVNYVPLQGNTCGYLLRKTDPIQGRTGDFVLVSLNTDSYQVTTINIAEFDETYGDARKFRVVLAPMFDTFVNLLVVIDNQELTIFIDGKVIIEKWRLDLPTPSDTVNYNEVDYEILSQNQCVIRDVWIYGLED